MLCNETAVANNGLKNAVSDDSMPQVVRMTMVLVYNPVHSNFCRVDIRQYQAVFLRDLLNDGIINLGELVAALFPVFTI